MAEYIARVELHNGTYQDYETLHASMQRRGFARTVVGSDNLKYQLPTATYIARNSASTADEACNAAIAAAKETGRTHSLIVTDWNIARWSGLPKV